MNQADQLQENKNQTLKEKEDLSEIDSVDEKPFEQSNESPKKSLSKNIESKEKSIYYTAD